MALPLISLWPVQALLGLLLLGAAALVCRSIFIALQARLAKQKALVDRINAVLPQTQCGQCGHPGCLPYARSISLGEASNKCPPGGIETVRELAELLNEPFTALDPAHGAFKEFSVAVIREQECIGCTKCIQACPVDAILGGPKLMHTVIERECTGCDLCVEPCPVDCIDMVSASEMFPIPTAMTYPDRAHLKGSRA